MTESLFDALPFREIWAVDFEFIAGPGARPDPVCLVARELRSGCLIRLWQDQLRALAQPPYGTGEDSLFVAYYASAELGCHLALGWPLPCRILDLFVEFRNKTNGRALFAGNSLVGALAAHGLDSMGADEKASMRSLIMNGGHWTDSDRNAILNYCQDDVDGVANLLPVMLPGILDRQRDASLSLGQSLLRGRYMAAAAHIEHSGIPIDVPMLNRLRQNWGHLRAKLVEEIDSDFGVYENGSFRNARFEQFLSNAGIPWPRHYTGKLDLTDTTFRDMARRYPEIEPLRELRNSLSQLKLNDLAVGPDGRNRTLLSAFRSRTGRNQPSNSKFIFGPSAWLRGLIKPAPGMGLAYVDFASQEIAIAAALSGDEVLMEAYASGDVYLAFAKRAGLAPDDATKATHKHVRDRCKAVVLGVQYGMAAEGMAARIGISTAEARDLLTRHKRAFPKFWAWSGGAVDHAMLYGRIDSVFGWSIHVGPDCKPRSLMNFPMQANGAEMLRLACCLATEAGLTVCAPVHDAILLEAPIDRLDHDTNQLRHLMQEAGSAVLDGFEVRTDAEIIRYPDRYADGRGTSMWNLVQRLLDDEVARVA